MATTLMRIGYCEDGAVHLETRHHDGSFPEIYTLDGDFLEDYVLADTFRPTGGPVVVAIEQPRGIVRKADWKAAAQALLDSIDEDDDDDEEGASCSACHARTQEPGSTYCGPCAADRNLSP